MEGGASLEDLLQLNVIELFAEAERLASEPELTRIVEGWIAILREQLHHSRPAGWRRGAALRRQVVQLCQ